MSWSFSVSEKGADEALREFNNKLFDNRAHIPAGIDNSLDYAARSLVENVKGGNKKVTLSTNGHFNDDGVGNCDVRMLVSLLPEEVPNVPAAEQPVMP